MRTYQGRCHCGAIKFTLNCTRITKGLRCNCSICRRKGTLMLGEAVDEADISIDAKAEDIGLSRSIAK